MLADWAFAEKKEFIKEYGCGYPGDPKTKAWLRANKDGVFGFPSLVRFSWKTCYSILEDEKMNVEWHDKLEDPKNTYDKYCQQKLSLKPQGNKGAGKSES